MTFTEKMNLAVELYKLGIPVVLQDESGHIIHGQRELNTLGQAKCRIIPDVDSAEWKLSEKYWQQILESVRRTWLENETAELR